MMVCNYFHLLKSHVSSDPLIHFPSVDEITHHNLSIVMEIEQNLDEYEM
jgi:hypothetical protein